MKESKTYPPAIRPLPYYNTIGSPDESRLAAALRREFVPKVKRLLPGHHLGGFKHDFIVSFVKRHLLVSGYKSISQVHRIKHKTSYAIHGIFCAFCSPYAIRPNGPAPIAQGKVSEANGTLGKIIPYDWRTESPA